MPLFPRPPEPDNKVAAVIPNFGVGDSFNHIGMVRYLLATKYEKVYFFTWGSHNKHADSWFDKDENVEVLNCGRSGTGEFHSNWNIKEHPVAKHIINCDWYLTAPHPLYDFPITNTFGKLGDDSRLVFGSIDQTKIPLSNYDAVNIPRSAFWDYAQVLDTDLSEKLFNKAIESSKEYIFLHNSFGLWGGNNCMEWKQISNFLNIDKDKILVVDPSFNHYESGHKWHDVAEHFVDVPNILSYKKLMLNAKKILVLDSAFLCMGYQLEPKTDDCYYMCRPQFFKSDWDFVYKSYIEDSSKKKTVKQFKKMQCTSYEAAECPMCGSRQRTSRPLTPELVKKYNSQFNQLDTPN